MAQLLRYLLSVVLFSVLHSSLADDGIELSVVPSVREVFVKDGGKTLLECTAEVPTGEYKLKWEKPADAEVTTKNDDRKIYGNGYKFTNNILAKTAGTYTCKLFKQENGGEKEVDGKSRSLQLVLVKETKSDVKWEYGNKTATVSCNIEVVGKQLTVSDPVWYKNGTAIKDLKDKERYEIHTENNSMTINKAQRNDAGMYTLKFTIDGDQKYDCNVAVMAGPFVLPFEKSKNLIEGEDMKLRCDVLGYPYSVVTWKKDGKKFNDSNERIKMTPYKHADNAQLTIEKVDFDDAGEYTCEAAAKGYEETQAKMITVRVKDKMAALWPFLGIVGEVIVLCTIIFIYEKRRNKQAAQANNNAHESCGTGNDTTEGLRHRNTPANNPRA